ncbi:hypothetical protein [Tabrizicola sp.]|uniref:hypothetical protein n=1 Tax=Tabrizicola sp. TaxID=2005166 RepID=UPI003F2AAEE3
MRLAVLLISACLPGAAIAQEATTLAINKSIAQAAIPAPSVDVTTTVDVSLPLSADNPLGLNDEGDAIRRHVALRAADACSPLLASSAKSCTITSISVSSVVYGDMQGMGCGGSSANTVYASATVTMRIEPQ